MSSSNLVNDLKRAAQTDAALRDLLLLFATRNRARSQITLRALADKMKKERFQHTNAEVARSLETLATLGVGTLERDGKGRVRGLRSLKYRLPQLGQAVIDKADLVLFKHRPRYHAVHPPVQPPAKKVTPEDLLDRRSGDDRRRAPRPYQTSGTKLVLTYILNGKPINIPVPGNLTPGELVTLVQKFTAEAEVGQAPQQSGTPTERQAGKDSEV